MFQNKFQVAFIFLGLLVSLKVFGDVGSCSEIFSRHSDVKTLLSIQQSEINGAAIPRSMYNDFAKILKQSADSLLSEPIDSKNAYEFLTEWNLVTKLAKWIEEKNSDSVIPLRQTLEDSKNRILFAEKSLPDDDRPKIFNSNLPEATQIRALIDSAQVNALTVLVESMSLKVYDADPKTIPALMDSLKLFAIKGIREVAVLKPSFDLYFADYDADIGRYIVLHNTPRDEALLKLSDLSTRPVEFGQIRLYDLNHKIIYAGKPFSSFERDRISGNFIRAALSQALTENYKAKVSLIEIAHTHPSYELQEKRIAAKDSLYTVMAAVNYADLNMAVDLQRATGIHTVISAIVPNGYKSVASASGAAGEPAIIQIGNMERSQPGFVSEIRFFNQQTDKNQLTRTNVFRNFIEKFKR